MTHFLILVIYLAFISLGLPDALLGAAWPAMYPLLQVPVSYAGILSTIISIGTVISSLLCDRLARRFGSGKVTAFSTALTAVALFSFSFSGNYWLLCLWSVPYGLGAGAIDACLNNYVALHYSSRHMSWLHCMWSLGAAVGPYVMGYALSGGMGWDSGYWYIAIIQLLLAVFLVFTLPIWKERKTDAADTPAGKALTFRQMGRLPGIREVLLMLFCYCALEQTAILWGASFLVMKDDLPEETAASLAGLFFIGLTAGRGISGFLTARFTDKQMILIGEVVLLLGIGIMLLPLGAVGSCAGLLLAGLGCAPIYPCVIHSTPACFGEENSQAIIGVQMASAYIGICLIPPLFGLIAQWLGAGLLPAFLAVFLVLMAYMHNRLNRICKIP